MKAVPPSLRYWFLIHGVVDYALAIPLFIFPTATLALFDLSAPPVLARIVAAALFAIGGISFIARDCNKETYKILLTLKLIWSALSIIAILLALLQQFMWSWWFFLGLFCIFFGVWLYYRIKL